MCNIRVSSKQIKTFLTERIEKAATNKIAIVLVGGPGSGKTSAIQATLKSLNEEQHNFINVDVDEIITNLFRNNTLCYNKAYVINNKLFIQGIEGSRNIILNGTGKDFNLWSGYITKLKAFGYTVNLTIVMNKENVVYNRIKDRAVEIGRDVKRGYRLQAYKKLELAIPKYIALSCDMANNIYLYDNSEESIRLVMKTSCIGNIKRLQEFGSHENKKSPRCKNKVSKKISEKSFSKSDKIYKGPRGGIYFMREGKKIYIKIHK